MQGKQNAANTERKGPHKSMHCGFCKPPGAATVEKPSGPQLETKTKVHLIHQLADLRLTSTNNEPGFPSVESEACMCVLEGENPCPKCVPDKTRPPLKKKVCRCPKGAKPHPSMFNETAPKKKKLKEEDDEFWWEKYSREHDAMAKETWAAYMAQRRKEKKLTKCQNEDLVRLALKKRRENPTWYRKLSCQQMIYAEFLSTAIRLDSDENITDRTYFVLGGIGLVPRPSRKILKKCLSYCHYNAVQFLNQLQLLTNDLDPFEERYVAPFFRKIKDLPPIYTWNEILIMSCISYLEFPALLRELMDRLPTLPREEIPPQIPYPVFSNPEKKKYKSPYEEPIWRDRLNWLEKMKIDRMNRCRAHMETKRVKIPPLALVRRPSLIDARPPFLAQIEANERASRRIVKEKKKKSQKKHPISTFNSAVDVTAIAGIEASEISTTDKADTDDICVFLREPKESESMEGVESEESDFPLGKEVRFLEEVPEIRKKPCEVENNSEVGEPEEIPFKTPPKTESGATIVSPFPPPGGTPGLPASHFESGKRELDILDNEICKFYPFVSSSRQTVDENNYEADDVEMNLKSAAAKLKKLSQGVSDTETKKPKKKKKKLNKKGKYKKSRNKKTTKKEKLLEESKDANINQAEEKEEEEEDEEEEMPENYLEVEDDLEGDEFKMTYRKKEKYTSSRGSEISDPDPDTDDEWSARPCTPDAPQFEEQKKPETRRKSKKRRKALKKKPRKKKVIKKEKKKGKELKDKSNTDSGGMEAKLKVESSNEGEDTNHRNSEDKGEVVFRGKVEPLVQEIIRDLAEEGFCCASFPNVHKHPDIQQLILHLKGKILNAKLRNKLLQQIKQSYNDIITNKELGPFRAPQLGLSRKRLWGANWNDKRLISRLAKAKLDQFYFMVGSARANIGGELYNASQPCYFGTARHLKFFYAYMISKYEDCILKGIL